MYLSRADKPSALSIYTPRQKEQTMFVYFDHNATTRLHPFVYKAMQPYLENEYGNASCLYRIGVEASYAIEKARMQVARLLSANESEIVFTSGGTESDNQAIAGVVLATGKKHIITSAIEHPAVLNTCRFLEKHLHCRITRLPVNREGFANPGDVRAAIESDTALVSIMSANNEIGSIQPLAEIGKVCRNHSVLFHTDAVQGAGRIPMDVQEWNADLASLSAHKIYGPKGVGALYIRQGTPFIPWIHGGSQEGGRRAGTENVPAIAGFGKAAELARLELQQRIDWLAQLGDYLWEKIEALPYSILRNSPRDNGLPGTINVSFPGIDAREFVRLMDTQGFCIATGSACSTGKTTPSYVLKAIGRSDEEALSSIRISLGRENTRDEIDRFITAITESLFPF